MSFNGQTRLSSFSKNVLYHVKTKSKMHRKNRDGNSIFTKKLNPMSQSRPMQKKFIPDLNVQWLSTATIYSFDEKKTFKCLSAIYTKKENSKLQHSYLHTPAPSKSNEQNDADVFLELVEKTNKFIDVSIYPVGCLSFPIDHTNPNDITAKDEIIKLMNEWYRNMSAINKNNQILSPRLQKMQYHGADLCDALLTRLITESRSNKGIFTSVEPFQICIECYRISGRKDAGQKSFKMLQVWNGLFGGDLDHAPGTDAFNMVLRVYKTFAKSLANAEEATKVLDLMDDLRQGGHLYIRPNYKSFQFVAETWKQVMIYSTTVEEIDLILSNATILSEKWMELLKKDDISIKWDAYSCLLQTYLDYIQVVHTLFNESNSEDYDLFFIPEWKRKLVQISERVDSLFNDLNGIPTSSIQDNQNVGGALKSIMNSLSRFEIYSTLQINKNDTRYTMRQMKQMMECLKEIGNETINLNIIDRLPDVEHYHAFMKFCTQCNHTSDSVKSELFQFADELLHEVEMRFLGYPNHDTEKKKYLGQIFYHFVQSCARNNSNITAKETEEKLLLLMTYIEDDKIVLSPDKISSLFNEVIINWTRCPLHQTKLAARHAESLLNYLMSDNAKKMGVKPTSASFSAVIQAFSRAKNEKKALEYLTFMEHLCALQETDDTNYNDENERYFIRPNTIVYTFILDQMRDVEKALSLWERMEKQYNKYQHPSMQPDAHAYRSIIDALTRSKKDGIAKYAQDILNKGLQSCEAEYEMNVPNKNKPQTLNKYVFTSVINAWGNESKKNPESSRMVLKNLQMMKNIGLRPDTITYTAAMKALYNHISEKNTKNIKVILDLLAMMENQFEEHYDLSVKPNVYTYTQVIFTLQKQLSRTYLLKSSLILGKMVEASDFSMHPSSLTFRAVLNSCCMYGFHHDKNGNKRDKIARQIALKTLFQYEEAASKTDLKTDDKLYATILKTYHSLIVKPQNNHQSEDEFHLVNNDAEIHSLIKTIVTDCCTYGKVSPLVFKELLHIQNNLRGINILSDLKGTHGNAMLTRFSDIPEDWKRKVV